MSTETKRVRTRNKSQRKINWPELIILNLKQKLGRRRFSSVSYFSYAFCDTEVSPIFCFVPLRYDYEINPKIFNTYFHQLFKCIYGY